MKALDLTEAAVFPAPHLTDPHAGEKWWRERTAFRRLLPKLLETHLGRYVAIHEGQVVDVGDDPLALAVRVLTQVGNVDIHVGRVEVERPPPARSGILRTQAEGGNPL